MSKFRILFIFSLFWGMVQGGQAQNLEFRTAFGTGLAGKQWSSAPATAVPVTLCAFGAGISLTEGLVTGLSAGIAQEFSGAVQGVGYRAAEGTFAELWLSQTLLTGALGPRSFWGLAVEAAGRAWLNQYTGTDLRFLNFSGLLTPVFKVRAFGPSLAVGLPLELFADPNLQSHWSAGLQLRLGN